MPKKLTKKELQQRLKKRGKPTSGTVPELRQRLGMNMVSSREHYKKSWGMHKLSDDPCEKEVIEQMLTDFVTAMTMNRPLSPVSYYIGLCKKCSADEEDDCDLLYGVVFNQVREKLEAIRRDFWSRRFK